MIMFIIFMSVIGAAFLGVLVWALVPESYGGSADTSTLPPRHIEDESIKLRKEIEAYNRKQAFDWDREFKDAEQAAQPVRSKPEETCL